MKKKYDVYVGYSVEAYDSLDALQRFDDGEAELVAVFDVVELEDWQVVARG
jgi:hypothetical protein